jgi:hypothetical protein
MFKYIILFAISAASLFSIDLSSKVTIITTCSPCPSYPRNIMLQISQYSLFKNIPQFESLPKIIVCDGPRNAMDAEAYNGYKESLKNLVAINPQFKNTKLVFCSEWQCLVGALKEALKEVDTEYMFIHQDDFALVLPIDLEGLISAMDQNHSIKMVRLGQLVNAVERNPYEHFIDSYIEGGSSFPLLRTSHWSDNDHFVRKDYYEDLIFPLIGDEKTFMEAKLMKAAADAFCRDPAEHIKIFGTYLYGKYNEGPYLLHLDRKSSSW